VPRAEPPGTQLELGTKLGKLSRARTRAGPYRLPARLPQVRFQCAASLIVDDLQVFYGLLEFFRHLQDGVIMIESRCVLGYKEDTHLCVTTVNLLDILEKVGRLHLMLDHCQKKSHVRISAAVCVCLYRVFMAYVST